MKIESNGDGRRLDIGHGGSGQNAAGAVGHSGRRFLIVAGLVFVLLWGSLFLGFREWRAAYRARAAYGVNEVAPAIDGLMDVVPEDPAISRAEWADAVRRTHAMLETVVSSNLLDLDQMRALRDELGERVERVKAHPETAVAELADVWDRMADRAEFLLTEKDRHPRPKILPPRKSGRR